MERQPIPPRIATIGLFILFLTDWATSAVSGPRIVFSSPSNATNVTDAPLISSTQTAGITTQFPWTVLIHHFQSHHRYQVCAGSIISKRWVLTAGHCVGIGASRFFLVFGEPDRSKIGKSTYEGQGVAMMSSSAEFYQPTDMITNNIGLIRTPKDIPFAGNIQPIELAGRSHVNSSLAGETAVLVGWNMNYPAQPLHSSNVSIISQDECSRYWPVGPSHICTAAGNDSHGCWENGGGPLVINATDKAVLIGIVSYGTADCTCPSPTVFTRISSYINWIEEVTGEEFSRDNAS